MADKVWKKQIGNQRPQIEGQTTQWPNEKGQKDKKTIYEQLHRKQNIEQHGFPLKTGGELVQTNCIFLTGSHYSPGIILYCQSICFRHFCKRLYS